MLTRSISRVIVRTCAALATTVTAFPRASLRPPLRFPTSQRWLSSADKFTPAAPPGTHGTPVFSDLDLNKISNEARRRREDPQAVYVVTGASRGIGLQFIKALAATTQVSAYRVKAVIRCTISSRSTSHLVWHDCGLLPPTRPSCAIKRVER